MVNGSGSVYSCELHVVVVLIKGRMCIALKSFQVGQRSSKSCNGWRLDNQCIVLINDHMNTILSMEGSAGDMDLTCDAAYIRMLCYSK